MRATSPAQLILLYLLTLNLLLENILKIVKLLVGFQVLSAVVVKSPVFWDIMTRDPLKANELFGGTYCFHLQGRRINERRNQHEAGNKQDFLPALCWFLSTDYTALYPRR
jgi:hypothetical protein